MLAISYRFISVSNRSIIVTVNIQIKIHHRDLGGVGADVLVRCIPVDQGSSPCPSTPRWPLRLQRTDSSLDALANAVRSSPLERS